MEQKVIKKRYPIWQFAKLERALDRESADGWQLTAATHKKQSFAKGGEACRHRIGYCATGKNSADYITYVAAQERAGWELVCEEQNWLYFRKPLSTFEADQPQRLEEDREGIRELFAAKTRRQENIRIVALILAAIGLVVGYATTNAIMRLAVIPLAVALVNTYLAKFYTESLENDALDD